MLLAFIVQHLNVKLLISSTGNCIKYKMTTAQVVETFENTKGHFYTTLLTIIIQQSQHQTIIIFLKTCGTYHQLFLFHVTWTEG